MPPEREATYSVPSCSKTVDGRVRAGAGLESPEEQLLYGEWTAAWAFGASWLMKGLELDMLLRGMPNGAPVPGDAQEAPVQPAATEPPVSESSAESPVSSDGG